MHKRQLHHLFVRLRPISYWYFAGIFVVSCGVAIYALRQNNLNALRLRDAVLAADEQNGDVEGALRELRTYTYAHMNTSLVNDTGIYPPIQLKYRYERLLQTEMDRASSAGERLYNDAQASCESRFPQGLSGSHRISCIQQYIDSHGSADPQPIPDALYKFDFVAPTWSPDLAGWSLVVAALALVLFVVRVGAEVVLRHQLTD